MVSAAFQLCSSGFPVLLRDTYKKVSGSTLCISFRKGPWDPIGEPENMKPLVFCLFAVCCWSLTEASADRLSQRRKLEEVHRQLRVVKNKLQVGSSTLSTPVFCWRATVFTHITPPPVSPGKPKDAPHAAGEHGGKENFQIVAQSHCCPSPLVQTHQT